MAKRIQLSSSLVNTDPRAYRLILGSAYLGATLEFYDFHLSTTASAFIFGDIFFNKTDSVAASIASLGTIAIGFLMRPIGAIVFGHIGDRRGRKSSLVTTILTMGLASVCIGLIPPFSQIGVMASVTLVLLRCVQGIAVGGEWGAATLIAMEASTSRNRSLAGSFSSMGAPSGALLSTAAFAAASSLPSEQFFSWGWRIPFLLSAVLLIAGLLMRMKISEPPLYAQLVSERQHKSSVPIADVLRNDKKTLVNAAGQFFGVMVLQGLLSTFILTNAMTAGVPRSTVLWLSGCASAVHLFALPAWAAFADRAGRRRVAVAGYLGMAAAIYPVLLLTGSGSPFLLLLGLVIATCLLHAPAFGSVQVLVSDLFGIERRCTGASLGYQMSSTLGYGLAPIIATTFMTSFPGTGATPVAVYVGFSSILSLLAVSVAPVTRKHALRT